MADELMGLFSAVDYPTGDTSEEILAFAKRMAEAHNRNLAVLEHFLGKVIGASEASVFGILHDNVASRPAGGTDGRAFYGEDQGKLFLDDGTDFTTVIAVNNHASLSGITINDHHVRDHASGGHYSGGADVLLHASMNISSDDHHAKNHIASHYSGGIDGANLLSGGFLGSGTAQAAPGIHGNHDLLHQQNSDTFTTAQQFALGSGVAGAGDIIYQFVISGSVLGGIKFDRTSGRMAVSHDGITYGIIATA